MPDKPLTILMADDDLDDCVLTEHALKEARITNPFKCVHDGQELLDYLKRRPPFEDPSSSPRPSLLLLDLNMPKVDGRAALTQIKQDPELRTIPVVILTTSKAEEDIYRSYDLGVNSFITKPVSFEKLVEIMGILGEYWLQIVSLPTDD